MRWAERGWVPVLLGLGRELALHAAGEQAQCWLQGRPQASRKERRAGGGRAAGWGGVGRTPVGGASSSLGPGSRPSAGGARGPGTRRAASCCVCPGRPLVIRLPFSSVSQLSLGRQCLGSAAWNRGLCVLGGRRCRASRVDRFPLSLGQDVPRGPFALCGGAGKAQAGVTSVAEWGPHTSSLSPSTSSITARTAKNSRHCPSSLWVMGRMWKLLLDGWHLGLGTGWGRVGGR